MMLPTHILIGLALVSPIIPSLPPSFHLPVVIGVILGSTFPDLDLVFGMHRKTLHTPYYGWIALGVVSVIAALHTTPLTIAAVAFTFGASQHSLSDVIGGGLEERPWEQTATRAVYNHRHKTWLKPRNYITYDGSPSDLAVFGVLGGLTYSTYSIFPYYTELLASLTIIGLTYTISRKILPELDEYLYHNIPIMRPVLRFFHGSPRDRDEN